MSELKSCPFCGEENTYVGMVRPVFMNKRLHGRYAAAGCLNCGAATRLFLAQNRTRSPILNKDGERIAKEKAADAWNRRAE